MSNRIARMAVGFGASVLLAFTAACSQALSPTAPTGATALAMAAVTNPDVPVVTVAAAGAADGGSGPCGFDQSTGGIGCATGRSNGLDVRRHVTFFDANGNVQDHFDAVTTASVKTETRASGTMHKPNGGTVTVDRSGEMTVTGLAGTETSRTLNGSEHGTVDARSTAPDGASVTEHSTITDLTQNLVIPVRASTDGPRFPLSGSRAHQRETTATRGSDTHTTTIRRVETFDGTNIVQVDITENGVARHCTVDLQAHTSTCGR